MCIPLVNCAIVWARKKRHGPIISNAMLVSEIQKADDERARRSATQIFYSMAFWRRTRLHCRRPAPTPVLVLPTLLTRPSKCREGVKQLRGFFFCSNPSLSLLNLNFLLSVLKPKNVVSKGCLFFQTGNLKSQISQASFFSGCVWSHALCRTQSRKRPFFKNCLPRKFLTLFQLFRILFPPRL